MLGLRIRELRINKKLSQKQLAEALGMGITAINNYENENRTPTADIILKMCNYFGVSSDYLLGLSDYQEPYATSVETIKAFDSIIQKAPLEDPNLVYGYLSEVAKTISFITDYGSTADIKTLYQMQNRILSILETRNIITKKSLEEKLQLSREFSSDFEKDIQGWIVFSSAARPNKEV